MHSIAYFCYMLTFNLVQDLFKKCKLLGHALLLHHLLHAYLRVRSRIKKALSVTNHY